MYNYEKLISIKKKYPNMHCSDEDFYKQYTTLELKKPKHIYELGVGDGGWIKCMNECLSYNPEWIGVENFISSIFEIDYYGSLPQSPKQLKNAIGLKNFTHYYTLWEPIFRDKIPCTCVRIDMDLKSYGHNLFSDTETVFIDDAFKLEYMHRLTGFLESNPNMETLWEGKKEICLIRSPDQPDVSDH